MDIQIKGSTVQSLPNFGKWLTFAEAIKSDTAIRLGIVNVPSAEHYKNMVRVYTDFYVPICERFGKLPVSSFFRCPRLNKAVKGSATSAHMAGCAIDIDCDGVLSPTNKELYEWCKANLKYDQLIEEYPDANGNPGWVHIANNRTGGANRQQGMRATLKNGQVYYTYE